MGFTKIIDVYVFNISHINYVVFLFFVCIKRMCVMMDLNP